MNWIHARGRSPWTARGAYRHAIAALCATVTLAAMPARAADTVYFSAKDNITNALVQRINAETVRIDMSAWYLTERAITQALVNRFNAGVKVRLIGDRGSIFEIDPNTRDEFYWVASQGVPIRLRYNPTWFPEIDHWKATIFAGQNIVAFGSANYTTYELAPWSSTNYQDEVVLFTDDQTLVKAFKTKFDRYWHDTDSEPESMIPSAPYFMDWDRACAMESACSDYRTKYPNPKPMVINTSRLEPDNPLPPDMVWGQGSEFNDRLTQEINKEPTAIDFVIYRLTVDNITNALIAKWKAGVPVRLIVEPNEYLNEKWPEFWITHANLDKLWAAGVPMRQRLHVGLTHMKVLLTSSIATIASSNFTAGWQRDHDYFLPAAGKPTIHQAMKAQFQAMWTNAAGFTAFVPQAPHDASLAGPADNATGVSTTSSLVWNRAPFATDYDVMLGTSSGSMTKVANVKAELTNDPPFTYSWTPASPLLAGTTYYWQIVSRTNATPVDPSVVARSNIRSFVTAGTAGGPTPPSSPSPANGATAVSLTPTLTWSGGAAGTTFNVAFGTTNPPPQVATGLTARSYQPGTLSANQTYFWRVTAVTSGGTAPGAVWSFVTGGGGGGATPGEVVIYASDVTTTVGAWSKVNDSTAAGGVKLQNADNGGSVANPLSNPSDYVEASFNAQAGTRYRVWFRIHPIADSKFNDSFFVQFSDSVDSGGAATYRIGTAGGYTVNLWTCSTCQTSGWGWQRNAYWLGDTGDVWFPTTGPHTIRVQVREDGVEIDQIVISPATFVNSAPGGTSNDSTIVPKPSGGGAQLPSAPGSPSPANNATGVSTSATLTWSAAGATSYDVRFGTTNPPSQVASNQSAASYTPSSLAASTTYFWQIVARNSAGTTAGPIWSFQTSGGGVSQPPAAPGSPSPANNATNVSATTSLTWSATGATSYDVRFGTTTPPPQVASSQSTASYTPSSLAANTVYFWQIVARNSTGTTTGPIWTFRTASSGGGTPPSNIVVYATDVPSSSLKGAWSTASSSTSPGGVKLVTSNTGYTQPNAPLATPVHFFDVTFNATANTPYRVWLRLQALNNDKFNDAVWVQFSDARANGSPIYPIGSTSGLLVNLATDSTAASLDGWGWQDGAYWLSQPTTVTFPTTGAHTMRIQVREDGVQLDQIVLSPGTYLNTSPGPPTRDNTIVVP